MGTPRQLPDMAFMRSEIQIFEVVKALGIKTAGQRAAHCWRVEHHKNGDRTPSLSFFKNRARCHVCDPRALSTIDLVAIHENCSLSQAVGWICARWDVPTIPKNAKAVRPQRWNSGRVGVSIFPLEAIVRTGFWASLDDAGRAVLVALVCFADPVTGAATISYRGLCRYSGKASRTTIAKVLRHLEDIGLLRVVRSKGDDGLRSVGSYQLTLEGQQFQSLLSSVHERLKIDRDVEKLAVARSETESSSPRLPKSRTLSTVMNQPETPRFTTVDRSVENDPQRRSTRFTPVDRGYQNCDEGMQFMPCYVHREKTPHWRLGQGWICELCHPSSIEVRG
jgi:hypothetical protein